MTANANASRAATHAAGIRARSIDPNLFAVTPLYRCQYDQSAVGQAASAARQSDCGIAFGMTFTLLPFET